MGGHSLSKLPQSLDVEIVLLARVTSERLDDRGGHRERGLAETKLENILPFLAQLVRPVVDGDGGGRSEVTNSGMQILLPRLLIDLFIALRERREYRSLKLKALVPFRRIESLVAA